jgi:RNA polymerase sigma factor FliA
VNVVVPLRPGLTPDQSLRVEQAKRKGLVEKLAGPLARKYVGLIAEDDLIALGNFGLTEAARTYQSERGPFEPYARKRVRGAMFDGIRLEAFEARVARAGVLAADELLAFYQDDFNILTHDADELQRRLDKLSDAVLVATLLGMTEEAQKACSPEEAAEREEYSLVRELLHEGVGALPAKLQRVIVLLYTDGHTQEATAQIMDVNVSTVLRRQQAALERLRKWMSSKGIESLPDPANVPEGSELERGPRR